MARIRSIKPGFFLNDVLAELPPLDRILFAGLWTLADREGRLEDRIKKIKAEILPYDDHDIDEALTRLADKNFIQRYEVKGCKYIQILNFLKHQCPNVKEHDSIIPAPYKHHTSTPRLRKGKEGKGKEQEGKDIVEIPDWIPIEAWQGYLEMREAKKKKPTERALKLIIDKLDEWRKKGHDPTEILNKATVNGWTDVYEPKTQGAPNGAETARNQGRTQDARTQAGGIRGDTSRFADTAEKFD